MSCTINILIYLCWRIRCEGENTEDKARKTLDKSQCPGRNLNFTHKFRWKIHWRFQIQYYQNQLVSLMTHLGSASPGLHSSLLIHISYASPIIFGEECMLEPGKESSLQMAWYGVLNRILRQSLRWNLNSY